MVYVSHTSNHQHSKAIKHFVTSEWDKLSINKWPIFEYNVVKGVGKTSLADHASSHSYIDLMHSVIYHCMHGENDHVTYIVYVNTEVLPLKVSEDYMSTGQVLIMRSGWTHWWHHHRFIAMIIRSPVPHMLMDYRVISSHGVMTIHVPCDHEQLKGQLS
jgi:hypothetical protein